MNILIALSLVTGGAIRVVDEPDAITLQQVGK